MTDQAQYLYIAGSTREGPLKIGIAANPQSRVRHLQTGAARKIDIYWVGMCPMGRDWEQKMHRVLEPWRLKGEWFDIPLETAFRAYLFVHDHGDQDWTTPDVNDYIARNMNWPAQEKSA